MKTGIHAFRLAHLERHVARYATAEEFLKNLNPELQRLGLKEIDASYLSQLRSDAESSRNIGPNTARKFEKGLGLEPGSFDKPVESDITPRSQAQLNAELVARKFLDLSPEQQALVQQTIETLRRQNQSGD